MPAWRSRSARRPLPSRTASPDRASTRDTGRSGASSSRAPGGDVAVHTATSPCPVRPHAVARGEASAGTARSRDELGGMEPARWGRARGARAPEEGDGPGAGPPGGASRRGPEPAPRRGARGVRRRRAEAGHRPSEPRRRALRRPDVPQGSRVGPEGPPAGLREQALQGARRPRHRSHGRELPPGGAGADRPVDHAGVRDDLRHGHRLPRPRPRHPQPLASRPDGRRLVGRLGRRRRRRHHPDQHVVRRRGLDPHPRVVLRAGRAEGHAGPGPAAARPERVHDAASASTGS